MRYDCVVVGAGPAGSTAARYLARGGMSVLMLEKRPDIGSPVRCGEGISRDWLGELGITPSDRWVDNEVKGARIFGPSGNNYISVSASMAGNEVGYVIERDKFDKYLASMAADAGADIMVKTPAVDAIVDAGGVVGVKARVGGRLEDIRCDFVLACDGFESEFARWAGMKDFLLPPSDMVSALQYRLRGISCDRDYVDFHFGSIAPGGYIWVFPKSEGEANVGIGVNLSRAGKGMAKELLDSFIKRNPALSRGKPIQVVSGGVSVSKVRKRLHMPGLLVVGDAARLIDPLTGGGISNACISGKMAAESILLSRDRQEAGQIYEDRVRERFEVPHMRGWFMKEKLMEVSDELIEAVVDALHSVDLGTFSPQELINAVASTRPSLMEEIRRFAGL